MADARDAGGPVRASAWVACGIVAGIAVVVAAGVVGWARWAGGVVTRGPQEVELLDEEPPTELAGGIELGEVPPEVAGAFDGPVVGARLLDEVPGGGDADCGFAWAGFDDAEVEVEMVLATPEVVHVTMLGTSPWDAPEEAGGDGELVRASCTVHWHDGMWSASGGGMAPAGQPNVGMTSSSCCDADDLGTAEAVVGAPAGADWAVQDRGGYHLAYPVPESRVIPVSWRFRTAAMLFGGREMSPTPTRVTFVDDRGEVLDEVTLSP